jgi:hypothetical protein
MVIFMAPTGVAVALMSLPRPNQSGGSPPPAVINPPSRLFRQLPVALGREVQAPQAEDHYVRVHTLAAQR